MKYIFLIATCSFIFTNCVKYSDNMLMHINKFYSIFDYEDNIIYLGDTIVNKNILNYQNSSVFYNEFSFAKGYFKVTLRKFYEIIENTNNYGTFIRPNRLYSKNDTMTDKQYIYIVIIDNHRMVYYSPYNKFRGKYSKFLDLDKVKYLELQENDIFYKKSKRQIKGYYTETLTQLNRILENKKCLKDTNCLKMNKTCKEQINTEMIKDSIINGQINFYGNPNANQIVLFQFKFGLHNNSYGSFGNVFKYCMILKRVSTKTNNSNVNSNLEHYDLEELEHDNLLHFQFIDNPIKLYYKGKMIKSIIYDPSDSSNRYKIIYDNNEEIKFNRSNYEKYIGF